MRALDVMVALSAGFMIAVSVGELLPESIERSGRNAALAALAGYCSFTSRSTRSRAISISARRRTR